MGFYCEIFEESNAKVRLVIGGHLEELHLNGPNLQDKDYILFIIFVHWLLPT